MGTLSGQDVIIYPSTMRVGTLSGQNVIIYPSTLQEGTLSGQDVIPLNPGFFLGNLEFYNQKKIREILGLTSMQSRRHGFEFW